MDASVVTYKECIATTVDLFNSGIDAVYVEGPPGCGKTTMSKYIQALMRYKGRFIIKIGNHDQLDFVGLPVPNHITKCTEFYASSSLLPPMDFEGGLIVVVDELPDSMTPNQNMACQWFFEGGMHNYKFPPGTKFFVTGNRVADKAGANRLITKIANRMAWLSLVPTPEEWIDHGYANGFNPSVLSFIAARGSNPINPNDTRADSLYYPTYFNSFDPQDPAQLVKPVFASSRSLEFTSDLINYMDDTNKGISEGALLTRVAALTGTPFASSYVPWRSESMTMPDVHAILRGDNVRFPDKESILWTLAVTLVGKATKNTWRHSDNFLKQGPAEYRMLAIRLAFDNHAARLVGPDFNATMQDPEVKQVMQSR